MPHLTTSDGFRLNYAEHGSGGPPAIVHPGLLSTIRGSDLYLAPLAASRRVIAYDHIGAGDSDRPSPEERSYAVERQVADALELADHLALERRFCIGWARGSATAARHALARPADVEKVVMMGPPLLSDAIDERPSGVADAFEALATKGPGLAQAFIDTGLPDGTAEQKRMALDLLGGTTAPDVLAAQLDANSWGISREEARSISCPTLIVWGTGDIIATREHVEGLVEAIPNATLVEIEGAGNGVWFTRADETYAAVTEFLA